MRKLIAGVIMAVMGAGVAASQTSKPLEAQKQIDAPPQILSLGSDMQDGSISVGCTGNAPYMRLACRVYSVWITRPSVEDFKKSRADLEKDLATKGIDDVLKQQKQMCSGRKLTETELTTRMKTYSPGRAATARYGLDQLKALCACTTKQCITSVMLEQQTHEQNECTIYNSVFPVDFVKVNDRKWVSNNGPEGICGVVSVFSIEHEINAPSLWTYTSHFSYTNNKEGLCKGLKDEDATYSWRAPRSLRMSCEEFQFTIIPELH